MELNGEVIVLDDLSTGSQDAIDNRAKFILGSTLSKEDINLCVEKFSKALDMTMHDIKKL